jgi:uncharacterized protein YdaU (DUF1376 family)
MAKDPAFLFYTGDFSTGTQFFTDEQVGKYVRLLMAQHQTGHLDQKHMLQICKTYDEDVFKKFIKDEDGKYYNQRLEDEINKRKNYSKSRSKNRSKKPNTSFSYVSHMENENENENINTIENGEPKKINSGNFKARGEEVLFNNLADSEFKAKRSGGKNNSKPT